jgi:hypothetical protein
MKKQLYFLSILLFISCSTELNRLPKPENVVSEDTMVMVLKDLNLIEAHIKRKQPIIYYNAESFKKSGHLVLKKYNLDTLRFGESFNYYASHQKKIEKIYSDVIDLVNKEIVILKSKK